MQVKTNATLVSFGNKEFTNKKGEDIKFKQAILAVDGEIFTVTASGNANLAPFVGAEEGEATLDITEYDGKIRMRLVNFE